MEVQQTQQTNVIKSRAKQIDTAATTLPMSNVLLGLPYKPTTVCETDKSGVQAKSWTYQELIGQERLISDILVTTSSNGIIWQYQNSWQNVLTNIVRNKMDMLFALKSWTLSFRFQFESVFQHVGEFVIFYSNLPQTAYSYHFNLPDKTNPPFENYMVQTQLPHRKIPMGEEVNCEVDLKWVSPLKSAFGVTSFNINSLDAVIGPLYDMGTLFLAIPWPLEIATGVTPTSSVRIWASLKDVTYSGYRPTDDVL
nr:MAG: hypothetical protein [Wufeng shrew polycipivirus 2]